MRIVYLVTFLVVVGLASNSWACSSCAAHNPDKAEQQVTEGGAKKAEDCSCKGCDEGDKSCKHDDKACGCADGKCGCDHESAKDCGGKAGCGATK